MFSTLEVARQNFGCGTWSGRGRVVVSGMLK